MRFDANWPTTSPGLIAARVQAEPESIACAARHETEGWQFTNWSGYYRQIIAAAERFRVLGLEKGDRLVIVADTSREWQILEFAAFYCGAVVVGVETHCTAEYLQRVLDIADPHAIAVDSLLAMEKIPAHLRQRWKFAVYFGTHAADLSKQRPFVLWEFDQATATPAPRSVSVSVSNHDPATIIFTSGTTGEPKAIQFTHGQLITACRSICEAFSDLSSRDRVPCWLPMSHLFQRMMNLVAIATGVTTYFFPDPRRFMEMAQETRPTICIAVPRFYEKLQESISVRASHLDPVRRWIMQWALRIASKAGTARRRGEKLTRLQRWQQYLADLLVLRRIRAALGGQVRLMISGSAPMSQSLLEWLDDLGWTVCEAYGISENAVPVAANRPGHIRFGSVGKPFHQNQIRIAPDGEVLVNGEGLFSGYLNGNQLDQFSPDGFYRTRDLGYFDEDGFLYLHGRKTDVFKMSTGRKIVPARIEAAYQQSPFIDQVMVCGAGKKHLVGLCWPNWKAVAKWASDVHRVQIHHEQDWANETFVSEFLASELKKSGQTLPDHERVMRFAFLSNSLCVTKGEVTNNFKLRRHRIQELYGRLVEELYSQIPHAPATSAAQTERTAP